MQWRVVLGGSVGAALVWRVLTCPRDSWSRKVVLITGGSRGLGLVLARQLVRQGASVMLMARDEAELRRAAESCDADDAVATVVGDVCVAADADRAVRETLDQFGRLDVLINNAGAIVSGPLADTPPSDFHELFDVHVMGTWLMSRAALPVLARPGGQIVNICSIGGRVPVPHLGAYCASKAAQAALSAVMAEEFRAHGVRVTTVVPGLMRTGSHLHARFRGDAVEEYRVFAVAAGVPGFSMSAERAARHILRAVQRGQSDITIPCSVRQLMRLHAVAPRASQRVLAAVSARLPGADGDWPDHAAPAVEGHQLALSRAVRAVTVLNERAATRNNERERAVEG